MWVRKEWRSLVASSFPWTTDTQWRHKSKKSENLGGFGRQNILRPYLKIWEWELISAVQWRWFPHRASVVRDHFHHVMLMHSVLQIWGTKNYASFFAYTVYVHIHTRLVHTCSEDRQCSYRRGLPGDFLGASCWLPSNVQIFWEGHKILNVSQF